MAYNPYIIFNNNFNTITININVSLLISGYITIVIKYLINPDTKGTRIKLYFNESINNTTLQKN